MLKILYMYRNMDSLKRDLGEFGDIWEVEKIIPLDQFLILTL